MAADLDITPEARAALLRLARGQLRALFTNSIDPQLEAQARRLLDPEFRPGLFVTLKKHEALRGCIGYLAARLDLVRDLESLVRSSAWEDRRFPPLRENELDEVRIELSILEAPRPLTSWREFRVGEEGIWMHHGARSAVFLPQVATEQGWNQEETLTQLSHKAGLPPRAWLDTQARFETFRGVHFAEQSA